MFVISGKKLLTRIALSGATLGLIVAGAAAFSAFEAHVVNVTARIENALTVPQELGGIGYGTVFPEEVLHKNLDIGLSDSFIDEGRVDDISYIIRQKPKCGVIEHQSTGPTDATTYSSYVQVTDVNGQFVCPGESVPLPLLCPYLSKHSEIVGREPLTYEDGSIDAFHGTTTNWTLADTINTQVLGHVQKGSDPSDVWDIDLHAPCFKGMCAQDNVVPASFEADPAFEHQTFGCDLWVEVTDISLPNNNEGFLTVTKVVDNAGGGTATTGAFSLLVDGSPVPNGVQTSQSVGGHVVSEGAHLGYNSVIGGPDCNIAGNVNVSTSTPAFCTITNKFIPPQPTTGQLTVHKIVVGSQASPNSFPFFVDGASVTNDVATTTSAGSHSVTETPNSNYDTTFGNACDINGNVTVSTSTPVTCDVTNTLKISSLTVTKVVDNVGGVGTATTGSFTLLVDGAQVTSGVATTTSPGAHVVSEGANSNYNSVIGGTDCNSSGNVTTSTSTPKFCTITNTAKFGTIIVNKVVVNNNGGTASTSNFTLKVGSTVVTNGVPKKFVPGSYAVSESGLFGYSAAFSIDCDFSGNLTLADGETKTCTITNDDIPPSITLIKHVVGGSADPDDFDVSIDDVVKTSGSSNQVSANTAHKIGEEVLVSGYVFTSITGSSFLGVPCPLALDGTITLAPGDVVTCTITNTQP